jgi:hypothetical protein
MRTTGSGAARLARLVWDQEVAGSNPASPTTKVERLPPPLYGSGYDGRSDDPHA